MNILLAVLQLFPLILSTVRALEEAVPLPNSGKAKLDVILSTVEDLYATEQNLQKNFSKATLIQAVTATVARIVAMFNALGIFKPKVAATI